MITSKGKYLGIDPTTGRWPCTWAVLSADGGLLTIAGGELEDAVNLAREMEDARVAVNAPARPNTGLVKTKYRGENGAPRMRGADLRLCEHLLRERGITIPPTPSRKESCSAWVQTGFRLHAELEKAGFRQEDNGQGHQGRIETNPHATFCALLGHTPLPKPSLEGRLQRQLVLHEFGTGIPDPMDFFEEVTRHRLMHGILPWEHVLHPDELDALAAAFTGWHKDNHPDETCQVGDPEEGQIHLPVRGLKNRYDRLDGDG